MSIVSSFLGAMGEIMLPGDPNWCGSNDALGLECTSKEFYCANAESSCIMSTRQNDSHKKSLMS